ncbi:MAG: hypothetical protein QXD03_02460 [Candidatus Anstonellales archaeon]
MVKIIGDNGYTAYEVSGSSIRVINTNKLINDKVNKREPLYLLGVAGILPNLQIELGRKFSEFLMCLDNTRLPILIQEASNLYGKSVWNIFRLPSGNVNGVTLCKVGVIDGIVVNVMFNLDLSYTKNFVEYEDLSAVSLYVVDSRDPHVISSLLKFISTVTMIPANEFKVKCVNNIIKVCTLHKMDLDRVTSSIEYTFMIDSRGFYKLASVGLNTFDMEIKQDI